MPIVRVPDGRNVITTDNTLRVSPAVVEANVGDTPDSFAQVEAVGGTGSPKLRIGEVTLRNLTTGGLI